MPRAIVPGKHYDTEFARWVRRKIKKNQMKFFTELHGIPQTTVYKWASGHTRPSNPHFEIYELFIQEAGIAVVSAAVGVTSIGVIAL